MARALRQKQPSSSVYRLLDCQAAARATRPLGEVADMRTMASSEGGPAPRLQFEQEPAAGTSEVRTLLDQYSYLYGSRPEFSFGFQWYNRGRTAGGTVPPLFGAPASAKLMLEAAILLSYARSERVPLFVVDPDGAFADAVRSHAGHEQIGSPASALIESCRDGSAVVDMTSLLLERWELFEQLLAASPFFELLQIRTRRKSRSASSLLVSRLRAASLALATLHEDSSFEVAWRHVASDTFGHGVYAPGGPAAARLAAALETVDRDAVRRAWDGLCEPFRPQTPQRDERRRSLASLVHDAFHGHPRAIIFDVSRCPAKDLPWNGELRAVLTRWLLDGIREVSAAVTSEGKSSNALVAVQETRTRAGGRAPALARRSSLRAT